MLVLKAKSTVIMPKVRDTGAQDDFYNKGWQMNITECKKSRTLKMRDYGELYTLEVQCVDYPIK